MEKKEKKEVQKVEEKIDVTGITVKVNGDQMILSNGSGDVIKKFNNKIVSVTLTGNELVLKPLGKYNKESKSMINSLLSHVKNMIQGGKTPFEKKLQVVYSHFPVTIEVKGKAIIIKNFLGEKNPRHSIICGNAKVTVNGADITVSGSNNEDVGQTCTTLIRAVKIRGKDIRVFQDGIYYVE